MYPQEISANKAAVLGTYPVPNQEVNSAESLASITPRIMAMAQRAAAGSNHIAASLGLVPSQDGQKTAQQTAPPSPTLINALREIEELLSFTLNRMELTNSHLNG